ncbi:hypothetical protein [Archangium sp.]|jgi:hypothetical protein|uniref:hypothetical protein n=1 Tax=Archangium sp. TaxID=1872627 RepID=UPI002ED93BA8
MRLELHSLASLSTLEQLVSTQGVEALLAALDEALARLPPESRLGLEGGPTVGPRTLRILRNALALDAPFLREHPEALFQCLHNRLRWFDAPDTASHFTPGGTGPWSHPEAHLFALAQHWRRQREAHGGSPWLESLLPLPGELESEDQALGEGPYALHRRLEPTPLVHFHDAMEQTVLLREGLVVGRGRTERDCLYVLKLRGQLSAEA